MQQVETYDPQSRRTILKSYRYGLADLDRPAIDPVWGGGAVKHLVNQRDYYSNSQVVALGSDSRWPVELWLDNCGSEVQDTYLAVRPEEGGTFYEGDTGGCDSPEQASLHVPALMPGSYLVMADRATDGEITLNVRGKSLGEPGGQLLTAIDAGTHAGGFFFTDTRNTAEGYTDSHGGAANDVFYRFALADSARVIAHNGGSGIEDTRLTLLASDGESVLHATDWTGQARIEAELPAGTYYLVTEGATSNGILVTTIEARGEVGSLSTTDGQPHVVTIVPLVKSADASALGTGEARQEVQYFDSFGNPVVKARHGFSSRGNDLYTLQGYDGLNRPEKEWLPVPLAGTNGMYVSPAELERAARGSSLYGEDEHPYSLTVYDGSALDEVVEEYGPGSDWHDAGRSVKTDRMTNFSAKDAGTAYLSPVEPSHLVAKLYALAGDSLMCKGTYETGTLKVVRTTDEDGNVSYEFTDRANGRVMLSRQVNVKKAADGTEAEELLDTYTVYDGYGNIRFVLPPMTTR